MASEQINGQAKSWKPGTFPGSVSGTYLHVKVTPSWKQDPFDDPPDLHYSVLYLLPSAHFAWFDYWSGFHYGHHAGTFTRAGASLSLQGRQSLWCDCPDQNYRGKVFECELALQQREGTRILLGLGEREHLFIGRGIHIPLRGLGENLFPQSWDALQGLIERFLGATGDDQRERR